MHHTQEEKRLILDEYNRIYKKAIIIYIVVFVAYAAVLAIAIEKFPLLRYSRTKKNWLYISALCVGIPMALYHSSVMKCPFCHRKYGRHYRLRPARCPHCGENLTIEITGENRNG